MKIRPHILALAILCLPFTSLSKAGGFGPGPWANGAYYEGQFDGTYTATVFADPGTQPDGTFSGTVISGVVGFALTGGSPRTIGDPPVIDNNKNFYAIFANGFTFTGQTFANVDISSRTVSGAFTPSSFTGLGVLPDHDFGGGAFMADINSDNATFTFSGNGMLNTSVFPIGGAPTDPTDGVRFEINGIKVAN